MIIVKLYGGLGNQLFQYALGRHLAEKNSTILKLDLCNFQIDKLRKYELHCFKILHQIASLNEIEAIKCENKYRLCRLTSKIRMKLGFSYSKIFDFYNLPIIIKEKKFSFDSSVLETKGNIYIDGYWQSEKYFSVIKNILLSELVIKYEQDLKNKELAKLICNTESVSLHIRRGDYVHDQLTNLYHGLCSFDYYQKAVDQIVQKIPNCHFYVFSDDPLWVRENFKLDYPLIIVDHNNINTNYEDLRLMSLCHHNIIANSSFSWWGAWLNKNPEKIVYAPEKWFNDKKLDTSDLIPGSWLKI